MLYFSEQYTSRLGEESQVIHAAHMENILYFHA